MGHCCQTAIDLSISGALTLQFGARVTTEGYGSLGGNHHKQNPTNVGFSGADLLPFVTQPRVAIYVQQSADGRLGASFDAKVQDHSQYAHLPAIFPEWLGDRGFCAQHGVRFPYVAGAMANGIATPELVVEMAKAGMIGFYGAAGLSYDRVVQGLDQIQNELTPDHAWGANLIHSPQEPELESRVSELFIQRNVKCISASAFMKLTPSVVKFAYRGIKLLPDGSLSRKRHVFAKISRSETASQFMAPAPEAMLRQLVASGELSEAEAQLAQYLPVAEDITAESDSGGHTDNRSLTTLLPDILALRDRMMQQHGFTRPIRVGAAGGIGTPTAVAAAFGLGADYVLTGSVNQAAIESGLSPEGRLLLADAQVTDVIMAPAADMFELGVEVQVLRRGTMFGTRGRKLHDYFHKYDSLESIPADERQKLEKRVLGTTVAEAWADTESFWNRRDPREVEKANQNPKHKMALVFRWYLGKASKWAIDGEPSRVSDYQIWCGPSMGAFNTWAAGSFLEHPENRTVVQIAKNLMEGAAVVTRAQQLRTFGVAVPQVAFNFRPRPLE